MGGTTVANIPANDSVGNLQSLLNLYSSAKGSSSTQTTSSNLSQTNVAALIQSILGSNQGLAAVSSGQKNAGLYNSSTNQQLVNDLLSRVTTQTAAQTAGTSTTTKTAGKLGGTDILTMLTAMAGNKVLGPSIKKMGSPLDDLGNKLADAFSGSSGALSPSGEAISGAGAEMAAGSNAANIGAGVLGDATAGATGAGAGLSAGELSASAISDEAVLSGGAALGSMAGADAALAAGGTEVAGTAATGAAAEGALSWEAIGTWIASLFSDERLKTGIKEVGATKEGQPIYTYKYKDNPFTTHMGVMAQETRPEAVVRDPSGYLRVNYDKLLGVD